MAWPNPRKTWTAVLVTVANLNTEVRDAFDAIVGAQWLYVDGGALRPDLTNGCDAPSDATTTAGRPLLSGPSFSGTADKYAQFKIQLPKRWNASTIQYRVHWTAVNANSGSGDVRFTLQGYAASDGDSIDTAFGTLQAVTDTFQGVKKHHKTAYSSALTLAGTPQKEDMCYFLLGRTATDGADTKTDAIIVEGVEFLFTPDTVLDS